VIQAGLFSAVTSAFVIQVHSQLQPDPNDETAALLRVLIHKIDNTTFGGDVPTVPQWTGPPPTTVHVEAILYASLATSIFSAFLAMLGKQWLNRYASIDMRGSAIERSQNRQRKLDGIVMWYFHYVMESLPLMLQFALLLLGCGLSLYLWGINTTVASVVVGITSLGAIFYALIVIAGAAFVSCPYQTPGVQILRHIPPILRRILPMFHSAFFSAAEISLCIGCFIVLCDLIREDGWTVRCSCGVLAYPLLLPILLAHDAYISTRTIVVGLLTLARRVCNRFRWVRSPQVDESDQQVVTLDVQCILWILQTSLDKALRLSTLKTLAAMTTLNDFNPALVSTCFNILISCVAVVGDEAVITRGLEEFATVSVKCCLRTIFHLTTMDQTSSVLRDVCKRYTGAFPLQTQFKNLPICYNFSALHREFYPSYNVWQSKVQWNDHKLSNNEHIMLLQLAQFKYRTSGGRKVPRWILRFALHYLSQDPPPPTSVIISCLSIIAIDLGCTVPATSLNKRYVHV